ncbi:MAG: hypothetical protein ACYTG5_06610 [Planctomycetota bacterium]|jgi:hypothetical protein
MRHRHLRPAGLILAAAVSALGATDSRTQSPSIHASEVIDFDSNNNAGGGIFDPAKTLGPPSGGGLFAGSLDVHSLGAGGFLTLGFDVSVIDGPGADFIVAENPFLTGPFESFAETFFVEVSSDGINFARFPSAYHGPATSPGGFGVSGIGSFDNLGGSLPVRAGNPGVDMQDVVEAGGDAFDLADLSADPLVSAGLLDLQDVNQVRLVDVQGGVDQDSRGRIIQDPSSGSADIDALTVLHHSGNESGDGPLVELRIPSDGAFELIIEDPNGLLDLDLASLRAALFGQPIDPLALIAASYISEISPTRVGFKFLYSLPAGVRYQLAFSIKDRQGQRSGASRVRPGPE